MSTPSASLRLDQRSMVRDDPGIAPPTPHPVVVRGDPRTLDQHSRVASRCDGATHNSGYRVARRRSPDPRYRPLTLRSPGRRPRRPSLPAMTSRTALTTVAAVCALSAGATAALATPGGRDHPEDDGTTTAETTPTTATTPTTETTGTTTGDAPTTPPATTTARAPRIVEVEVDDAPAGRIRLRAEVKARGAAVTSVRFTYRGERYTARRNRRDRSTWTRVVTAAEQDLRDDAQITVRVRACAGDRCSTRTVRDDA